MVIIYPLAMKIENTISIKKIQKYTFKADVKMTFSFFLFFSFFLNLISSLKPRWKKFTNLKFPHQKSKKIEKWEGRRVFC